MDHSGFWHNQTYKPSWVFDENEYQVYNKMHTSE